MKMKKQFMAVVCAAAIITAMVSCNTEKKTMALKNQTVIKDQQQKDMLVKINDLSKLNKQKLEQSETNESSGRQVQQMIDSIQQNLSDDLKNDSEFLAMKNVKRSQLKFMQKVIEESETKQVMAIDDIGLLSDFLNTTTFTRLNMAAFFGSGDYIVDAEKLPGARASFKPVIKDIENFIAKYKARKLLVTIVSVGYADEQPISDSSSLYRKLIPGIGYNITPTRQQLNAELSRLRAYSISDLIKNINSTEESKAELNYNRVAYLVQGRGEMLPSPKVTDYKPDDERRRIVVIYWGILPER